MAGLLEMLLAAHMGRGLPMGMPGLPPAIPPELLESGAEPDAAWTARPPALASGAEPSGAWTGGITPPVQRGLPKDTGNPLMGMLASLMQPSPAAAAATPDAFNAAVPFAKNPAGFAALDAARAPRRTDAPIDTDETAGFMRPPGMPNNQQPDPFTHGTAPIPGIDAVAGLLSNGGQAASLPPSTNDPASGEPQVFANGVPLPRPKPIGASGLPAEASEAQAAAPLSMAPPSDVSSARRAAPGAPAASGGGLGDIMGKLFNPANAPLLLALGSGLAGAPSFGTGMRRASAAAVAPAALLNRERQQTANQAQTYQALIAKGVPPQEAAAALRQPELLKALIAKHFETKPAQVVNGRLVRENADGSIKTLADYSDDKAGPKLSDGYQWTDPADKSKGQTFIVGGVADPKVKAQNQRQSEPPKYEWVDPDDHSKGQRAIKGGGAERVDANVAARLGMARSFMDQLPEIRRRVKAGEATGPWDAAVAKLGYGAPGELRRQIDSGAEALLRNLTGAGMNVSEAEDYARRYKLQAHDTAATMLSKLDQLGRELIYTDEAVRTGRGGTIKITNGKILQTDDAAPVSGKTKTGINYSLEP